MILPNRKSVFVCLIACLFVFATPAFSATRSWTGAVNSLWSVGGNWSGGVAPVNADDLAFPAGAASSTPTNDIVGLTIGTVNFPHSTAYNISGNALTLTAGIYTICCTQTWNIPTTLGASQVFVLGGEVNFSNTIALAGHTLTMKPSVATLSGSITGPGNVDVVATSGVGILDVTGSIAIAGDVSLTGGADLNVDGSIAATALTASGASILTGDGILPATISNSATIWPGDINVSTCCNNQHTLAILTTGNLTATSGTIGFDVVTTTPGSGHDQLAVNGTVTLNNPSLQITYLAAPPAAGASFVIIANDGVDPVSGTFAGLPEGATFTVDTTSLQITYAGGTGNDVVLTVVSATKSWTGAVNSLWRSE